MLQNKFNLCDKVINKRTGFPTSGIIVSILEPIYFIVQRKSRIAFWKELYPDWESKPVYIILLDQPHKPITKEDYLRDTGLTEHNPISLLDYRLQQSVDILSFPEDDLERLD